MIYNEVQNVWRLGFLLWRVYILDGYAQGMRSTMKYWKCLSLHQEQKIQMFCSPCSSCPFQKFGIWFGMTSQIIVPGVAFWKVATPKYTCLNDMLLLECFFGYHKITLFLFRVFKVNSHWLNLNATHQPYFHIVGFSRSTYHLRDQTMIHQKWLVTWWRWFFFAARLDISRYSTGRVPGFLWFLISWWFKVTLLIIQTEVTFDHLKGSLKPPPKGSLGRTWLKIWKCISTYSLHPQITARKSRFILLLLQGDWHPWVWLVDPIYS